jgi:hypothetical protein
MEALHPPEAALPTCPTGSAVSATARTEFLSAGETGCHFGQKASDAAGLSATVAGLRMRVLRATPSKESAERWERRGPRLAEWLLEQWQREQDGGDEAHSAAENIEFAFDAHRAIPSVEAPPSGSGPLSPTRTGSRPPRRPAR